MTIPDFPQKHPDSPFLNDIIEFGYHLFSLKNAKIPNYYPNEFPNDFSFPLKDLKVDDVITIRVFFRVGSGENIQADGGYIDLEVGDIFHDRVTAVILTPLPEEFPLKTGSSIEIFEEEILSKVEQTEH